MSGKKSSPPHKPFANHSALRLVLEGSQTHACEQLVSMQKALEMLRLFTNWIWYASLVVSGCRTLAHPSLWGGTLRGKPKIARIARVKDIKEFTSVRVIGVYSGDFHSLFRVDLCSFSWCQMKADEKPLCHRKKCFWRQNNPVASLSLYSRAQRKRKTFQLWWATVSMHWRPRTSSRPSNCQNGFSFCWIRLALNTFWPAINSPIELSCWNGRSGEPHSHLFQMCKLQNHSTLCGQKLGAPEATREVWQSSSTHNGNLSSFLYFCVTQDRTLRTETVSWCCPGLMVLLNCFLCLART